MAPVTQKDLERIREQLEDRAFLYESPDAFEAGADAAIDALHAVASTRFDRSDLADENGGAVSASGLVIELEDMEASAR